MLQKYCYNTLKKKPGKCSGDTVRLHIPDLKSCYCWLNFGKNRGNRPPSYLLDFQQKTNTICQNGQVEVPEYPQLNAGNSSFKGGEVGGKKMHTTLARV